MPGPRFTYEDYLLMPEDKRCEIIEGDLLMTPAPTFRHQDIISRILVRLWTFAEGHGLGKVVTAPVDVVLSAENVVQPDVLFIAKERLEVVDAKGVVREAPDLAIEILSPSTASRDQVLKRKLYDRFGVQEYWVVDPDGRTVEVLTRTPEGLSTWRVCTGTDSVTSLLLPGLSIPLTELFAE